ncbi:hypothetical protein ACJX0J_012123, partial [Zea mays]
MPSGSSLILTTGKLKKISSRRKLPILAFIIHLMNMIEFFKITGEGYSFGEHMTGQGFGGFKLGPHVGLRANTLCAIIKYDLHYDFYLLICDISTSNFLTRFFLQTREVDLKLQNSWWILYLSFFLINIIHLVDVHHIMGMLQWTWTFVGGGDLNIILSFILYGDLLLQQHDIISNPFSSCASVGEEMMA